MSTVIATRIMPADPASTALMLSGRSALDFWPGVSRVSGLVSPLQVQAALGGDGTRRLVIQAAPPRRTPTSYVTDFSVDADGLPPATGRLRVTRAGWLGEADPTSAPTGGSYRAPEAGATTVRFELHTDVDFDENLEEELAAAAARFLDNVAEFVTARAA